MAAVLCRSCSKRCTLLNKSTSTQLLRKYFSAQSAQEDVRDITSDRQLKSERDKLKVLNALASTIKHVPNAPMHGFFEDPFLMPRTSTRKNEFMRAREEGEKAAEYVINTYPDLFPLRKPEPEWPKELRKKIKGENETTLLELIGAQHAKQAINLYEKLIAKGEEISLDCKNQLLELTGYYGIQRSSTDKNEVDEPLTTKGVIKWRNFYADQLFNKISSKDAQTYEVIILSLLKYRNVKYASSLLEEMKEKSLKGSVFFYNQVISNSEQLTGDHDDIWSFAQDVVQLMSTEPVVKPNTETFRCLLKICAAHCTEPYQNGLKILREMYNVGLEPSLGCYTHLLQAAENNGEGHGAVRDIVRHLKTVDVHLSPESTADYDFFVTAMATIRHFRDGGVARQLFELAESSNLKPFLGQRSLSFYGNLLCSLALSEHANTVMKFYHQLVPKYFVPREWIYVELLRCLERSKQPHRALELYNDIKQHRVNMTLYTCRSLVSCFSVKLAKEHLPEYVKVMEEIFQWMDFFDVELDDFMRSQMIRIYCLNGDIDTAWGRLQSFNETTFTPTFAALSSLLQGTLSMKQKHKAKDVFQMMSEQGFRLNASLRNSYYRELDFTAEECYQIDQLFSNQPNRRERPLKATKPSSS